MAEPSATRDAPNVSGQDLGDQSPDRDQTVYTYRIRLNEGGKRYLQVRSAASGAAPIVSYGAGMHALLECKAAEDDYISNEVVSVETIHGSLYHKSGEAPVWTTQHAAELMLTKPKTNRAEVSLNGSKLYKIELVDGTAYFCLVDGYKAALYGRDVEDLWASELLKGVEVFRDGGSMSIDSEHGYLCVPSPQEQEQEDQRPEWHAKHKIEQI
ncbi:hypothetical protein V2A60_008662 [Cordyceps javanica]